MSEPLPRPPSPSIVTPGNHDGVHLGHRALVQAAARRARTEGLCTTAMFFDPHPTRVLAPDRAPVLLTGPGRRVDFLKGAGADAVAVLPFDEAFARTSPEVFVKKVLIETCNAKGVVVGPDFHFGHRRSGNIATLRALGRQHGFDVEVVEPVMYEGEAVSSTRIRRLLCEGDVASVASMLTRVHEIDGEVILGDQRGRTIGFPTANLDVSPLQLPADGVYAVAARVLGRPEGARLRGVANLGVRPTMNAGRSVEVHLFDFDADLYGERLRVGFVEQIREERRFEGLEALKAQIARDAVAARECLERAPAALLDWI